MTETVAILAAGLAGLILGSFAAAASFRLPRGLDIVAARSACPQCGAKLSAYDLVPIASFFWLGRRCRRCAVPISWRYPAIESATAALCAFAAWRLGPGIDSLIVVLLVPCLMIAIVSDLESGIIPDIATIAASALAAVLAFRQDAILWRLLGAGFGLGFGLGLRWLFRRARGIEGLGLGDVKFFGAAGLWIGVDGLPVFFLLAGLLGIAFAALRGRQRIPFGPALALALYAMVLYPRLAHAIG